MPRQTVSSQSLKGFYARDLARRNWQFTATLGFRRRSVPFWMADRMFKKWIFQIEGGDDSDSDGSCWFRMNVHGAFPDKPSFYVLVGGLETISRYTLMTSWQEIAGDAKIEYCHARENALAFVADIARPGAEFDIDSELV